MDWSFFWIGPALFIAAGSEILFSTHSYYVGRKSIPLLLPFFSVIILGSFRVDLITIGFSSRQPAPRPCPTIYFSVKFFHETNTLVNCSLCMQRASIILWKAKIRCLVIALEKRNASFLTYLAFSYSYLVFLMVSLVAFGFCFWRLFFMSEYCDTIVFSPVNFFASD